MRSQSQRVEHARTEHLRVTLRHSIFVFLGNIAGSVTLVVGLWTPARQSLLITWMLVVIVFNLARWLAVRRFPTGSIAKAETRFWERLFVASVAISGVLWGAAGGLFYIPDQPEHGLFLALLIVAMCAAATASLSYHRIAYPVFLLPAITPIMLHLMTDEKLTANAIGFVIPFYFTLLYLLSREIYRTAHESILGRIKSQYQANHDQLTGVVNRRGFEEAMEREWYRAMRDKHVLSLVIADIDSFKLCNDTHGHEAGDLVLKSVAALLERHIRRGADLVARIGGEEFAIILPDTDLNGAVALAESIRVGAPKLAASDPEEIPAITMSFGVSSLVPDSSLNSGLLFSQADAVLYDAKRKGKDRVVYTSPLTAIN
jgi:diguanylate cyclase (GGDEF)-like protein